MIQIANATNRGDERTKSAGKCGQIYGGLASNSGPGRATQYVHSHLILQDYLTTYCPLSPATDQRGRQPFAWPLKRTKIQFFELTAFWAEVCEKRGSRACAMHAFQACLELHPGRIFL
jgi:hypothetical protein